MTAAGWLALAVAGGLLLAPRRGASRALGLAAAGRLIAADSVLGWPVRLAALPWERVAVAVAALTAAGVWLALGFVSALTLGAVFAVAGVVVRDARARSATARGQRELLTAVRVLVAELEAGSLPARALSAAAEAGGRVAGDLARAAAEQENGGSAARVLMSAAERPARAIGIAWQLGESTGAALAGVIERVGADLAAVAEQRRAVAVALAGPRSSAILLAGLPALGIALGAGMGARPLALLTGSLGGQLLCAAGVSLDLAGVLWMRHILAGAEHGPRGTS